MLIFLFLKIFCLRFSWEVHFGESGASLVFRNDSFVLVWWDYLDFGVILAAYPLCGSWWGVKIIWYEMSLRKDAFQ